MEHETYRRNQLEQDKGDIPSSLEVKDTSDISPALKVKDNLQTHRGTCILLLLLTT